MNMTQRVLDSDDEYPDISSDELDQCVDTPAYLMDDRFNEIDFDLSRLLTQQANEKHNQSVTILKKIQNNLYLKTMKANKRVVIERCMLTMQDMLCLREVEPKVSDAVFVWFLNYIKRRDIQKFSANHLVSCLVCELQASIYKAQESTPFKKMHKFNLVDTGRL